MSGRGWGPRIEDRGQVLRSAEREKERRLNNKNNDVVKREREGIREYIP